MEEMISEKNEREDASSSCSNSARKDIISIRKTRELRTHTLSVFITQGPLPHIRKLDCALGTGVHEPVTADGVEFGRGDDLSEFFHISRLDIHDVEALILDVQIPQVHTEIVTADKGFTIAVNGDAIYMIGVCVGVCSPRDSGNHSVVVCQAGQFESRGVLEGDARSTRHASASDRVCWCELI
jgi:hypothetical protein